MMRECIARLLKEMEESQFLGVGRYFERESAPSRHLRKGEAGGTPSTTASSSCQAQLKSHHGKPVWPGPEDAPCSVLEAPSCHWLRSALACFYLPVCLGLGDCAGVQGRGPRRNPARAHAQGGRKVPEINVSTSMTSLGWTLLLRDAVERTP